MGLGHFSGRLVQFRVNVTPLLSIGVGRTDWCRPLPPPNRAGGSPAHGSPVSGLACFTSKRIDRPVHGPLLSYTARDLQRRHSASDDDLNRDHVLCDRYVSGGCFAASSESSRPARKTSSCSCA